MALAAVDPLLTFAALLGASVWVGGFVAIGLAVRVARRQLSHDAQVPFFRALGRHYLPIGCGALGLALAAGGAMLSTHPLEGTALAAIVVASCLVVTLAAGVVQAKDMTRLRSRLLATPADLALASRVRRRAIRAAMLRAAIGLLSLALLALAAVLASPNH